MKSMRKNQK